MNLNNSPTVAQLAALFAACDDEAGHHVVWVDNAGEVFVECLGDLTPIGLEEKRPTMKMRCEAFAQGGGYVGPEAAEDLDYVQGQLNFLLRGWAGTFRPGQVKFWDGFDI